MSDVILGTGDNRLEGSSLTFGVQTFNQEPSEADGNLLPFDFPPAGGLLVMPASADVIVD